MYKPFRTFIWIMTTIFICLSIGSFYALGVGNDEVMSVFGLSITAGFVSFGVFLSACILVCFLFIMEKVYKLNVDGESIAVLKEYLDRALVIEKELSSVMRNMDKFSKEDELKLLKALTVLERCSARMKELSKAYPNDSIPEVCIELTANLANIRTYLESTRENDKAGEQANVPINVSIKNGDYKFSVVLEENVEEHMMNHNFRKGLFKLNYLYKEEIRNILENEIASEIYNLITGDKKLQVEIDSFITEMKNQESKIEVCYVRNDTLKRKFSQALSLDSTIHLLECILNSDIIDNGCLKSTEYLTKNSSNYVKATVANTWCLVPYVSKNDIKIYLSGKVIEEVFGKGVCYTLKMLGGNNE